MSRKIFIEAFLWVTRARFTGDKAVRPLPAAEARARVASQSEAGAPGANR
jgi:hypothetical protein